MAEPAVGTKDAMKLGGRRFAALMARFPISPRDGVGVAVSGGPDSMALAHLMAQWARRHSATDRVLVFTVDHALRPESAAEAALVRERMRDFGLQHTTERIDWGAAGSPRVGRLQVAARNERLRVYRQLALRHDLRWIVLAHNLGDALETLLMRVARASSLGGLAGMAHSTTLSLPANEQAEGGGESAVPWRPAPQLIRPLLGVSKRELRLYCEENRIPFVSDPSNEDDRFDRVRARRALAMLIDDRTPSETAGATTGAPAEATADGESSSDSGKVSQALALSVLRAVREAADRLDNAVRKWEMRCAVSLHSLPVQIRLRQLLAAPAELRAHVLAAVLARVLELPDREALVREVEPFVASLARATVAHPKALCGCLVERPARSQILIIRPMRPLRPREPE